MLCEEDRETLKSKIRELLLLPGKGLQEGDFTKYEEELAHKLDKMILDPNWSDYLFYPSKNNLPDCIFKNENGSFEIDENAIDAIIAKINEYKPISL